MSEFLKSSRLWSRSLRLRALEFVLVATVSISAAHGQGSQFLKIDQIQGTEPAERFVDNEFIVVLKPDGRTRMQVGRVPSNRPVVNLPSLQGLIDRHAVGRFRRQFSEAQPRPLVSRLPDLTGHYKVQIAQGVSLEAALADFANDPNVDHVEKIGIHPVFVTPNDSFYLDQWQHSGPNGIDSSLAWDKRTGDPSVVVAVLDTGVHYNHPDLKANIWVNSREIPNNGIDDDHNGYIDDINGYDFVESATGAALFTCCDADCGAADNDPGDHNGHGTHLAGIVSAVTNNSIGVSGIAGGFGDGTPQSTGNGVRVMPLRIGWNGALVGLICGYGLIRMDYAAEALHYVALQKAAGVNVAAVNCSWGSSDTGGLGAAVDEVLASDVMVIHAAGNSGDSTVDFLGSKAGVMSVAATDQNGAGASFTNFGDYVEISAPGVDITSLWVGPDPSVAYYGTASGTSMATPHASAVAALLESANPALTGPQKFSLMVSNTKPYVNDGRNLGSGILNANLALTAAGPSTPDYIVTASPSNRVVAVGTSTSYDLTVTALSGFSGTVSFSASGLPFGAVHSFSPGSLIGSASSTMTVTTAPETPPGNYPITITAAGGGLSHAVNVMLTVYIPGASLFLTTNTSTQGTWKGVYGAEGFVIANDATNYPGYSQITFSNQLLATWAGSTTDVRALQKGAPTATDRIASTWVSNTSFDIDINLIDGNWHRVAFYCVDWDNRGRAERFDILDAGTGAVLDSRTLSGFTNGQYLVWNLTGHVRVRVTRTGGDNAVVSGLFFDEPASPDFSLTATPTSQAVARGDSTTYNLTVTSSLGFSAPVGFSAAGLPSGASASFTPSSVVGSGSSVMTLSTGLATPTGSFPITITGTSGSLTHSANVTLVVALAGSDFDRTDTETQGTWKGVYGAEGFVIANDATNYPGYSQITFSNQLLATWAGSTTDVRALQKGAPTATDRIASTWVSNTSFDIDINLIDGNWHRVAFYCVDWDNRGRAERFDILDAGTGAVLDSRTLSGFTNGQYLVWKLKGHVRVRVTRTGGDNAVVSGLFFDQAASSPDFSLTATPTSQAVARGDSTTYNLTVTSSLGFSAPVGFSAAGLPSGASASFTPSSVVGSGSSVMTLSTGLATPTGSFPITITGTSGSLTHSANVTLVVALAGSDFDRTDTETQGTWKGVYGAEGFVIANDATNYPGYSQITFSNQLLATWAGSTTDVRALQKGAPTATDRIASTWVSNTSFDIDINLIDGNWHRVAFYCVDWDNRGRAERFDILDAGTGAVLDSRTLSGFTNGQYLVWKLKGHVRVRVTRTGGDNAVVSGLFFDQAASSPDFSLTATPTSQAVARGDSTTYNLTVTSSLGFSAPVGFSAAGLPSGASASFTPSSVVGSGSSVMTLSTGLATPTGSFPITITGTSGSLTHSANVTLVVALAGSDFDRTDTETQGTWKGVYGAEGFVIANDATNYPGYSQITFSNQLLATWAGSTTDVRALQKGAPTATDRIASTWVSNTSFDIDINLIDGNWHRVAFYCVDWDNRGRAERFDILDAGTGAVLDSRTLSGFTNGQYLVWKLKGHVRVRVTRTGGDNAVVSGLFFD